MKLPAAASRRLFGLIVWLCLAFCLPAWAQAPQWNFALPADVIENRNRFLDVVNPSRLLARDFVPHNLRRAKVRSVSGTVELRSEAAQALEEMFAAAEKAGYQLYVKSAYRSYQTQNTMYANRLEKYNRDDGVVAPPGSSDHQTGLGVDILDEAWSKREGMTPEFAQTAEAQWMAQNAAQFGFVLRYMEDKQPITGIIFEPWHFRYVGGKAARYIMDNHLSLEEFDQQAQAAIQAYEAAGGDFKALCRQLTALPAPKEIEGTQEDGDSEVSIFHANP